MHTWNRYENQDSNEMKCTYGTRRNCCPIWAPGYPVCWQKSTLKKSSPRPSATFKLANINPHAPVMLITSRSLLPVFVLLFSWSNRLRAFWSHDQNQSSVTNFPVHALSWSIIDLWIALTSKVDFPALFQILKYSGCLSKYILFRVLIDFGE